MPKGPQGQRRPADVIGAAVMVARIATGELIEKASKTKSSTKGKAGGIARAHKLNAAQRKEISKKAAKKRWD